MDCPWIAGRRGGGRWVDRKRRRRPPKTTLWPSRVVMVFPYPLCRMRKTYDIALLDSDRVVRYERELRARSGKPPRDHG